MPPLLLHLPIDCFVGTLDGEDVDGDEEKGEKKEQEGPEFGVSSALVVKEGKDKDDKEKEGKDEKGDAAGYAMSVEAKAAAEARHTENREGTKIALPLRR